MTVAPPELHQVTTAVVAMLATITGRPVGDGEAPADTSSPYAIVYELAGGRLDGDAAATESDAYPVFQVTAVGATRLQAAGLADRCRTAILGRSTGGAPAHAIDVYTLNGVTKSLVTDVGLRVVDCWYDSDGGADLEGPLHQRHDRYVLWVSPA